MRLSVALSDGERRKRIEDFIREIFPNITVSSPETVIEKNKPGIIVLDEKKFREYQPLIERVRKRDGRLNFSVVIAGEKNHLEGIDFYIDPENLTDETGKVIKNLLMNKMDELTRERLKERVKDVIATYDKLGFAIVITDKKGKIVYFNTVLKRFLRDGITDTGILNLNIVEFFRSLGIDSPEVEDLLNGNVERVEFFTRVLRGMEVSVFGSPMKSSSGAIDGYMFIIRDISLDHASKQFWNIFEDLNEEFGYKAKNIKDFLEFIPGVLKRFSSSLGLRNLIFIPVYLKKTGEHEDNVPVYMVYRRPDGTYEVRFTYDTEVSEEERKKCLDPGCNIEEMVSIFKKESGESYKLSSIGFKKYVEKLTFGETILGIICLDRETELIPQERSLLEWFANEITNRMVHSILEYRITSIDMLENTIGKEKNVAIVVLDQEGTLVHFNDGFLKTFGIPVAARNRLHGANIKNLPGLKNYENVIKRINELINTRKPEYIERWISLDRKPENSRFFHIHIYPIKGELAGRNLTVWIFFEKTKEKLSDARRKFVHDVIVQKTKIYKEIGRSVSEDNFDRFVETLAEAVCDKLGVVTDGVVLSLEKPPDFSVLKTCPKIREILNDDQTRELINYVVEKRRKDGISEHVCNIKLEVFDGPYKKELLGAGYRYILVIPIRSPAGSQGIGHIMLFVKYNPNNIDNFMIFSKVPSVCNVEQINREEVDIFVQFTNVIGDYLNIVRKDIENKKHQEYLRQIFENVEDAILVLNREGIVERSNSKTKEIFGLLKEEIEGRRFQELFNMNVKDLIDEVMKIAFSRGAASIDVIYRVPEGYLNFNYEDERRRRIRLKFQILRLLGQSRMMIVARDVTDLTTSLEMLKEMTSGLLWTLLNLLGAKSVNLKIHSANVAYIVNKISGEAYPEKFSIFKGRGCLVLAAVLHDVGKIRVPSSILVRPMNKLIKDIIDYEVYKKHVVYGRDMMANIPLPCGGKIPIWIYQHHELMDGSGYPEGLKGDKITFGARIISAANYFENQIITKPFQKGKPPMEVIDNMRKSGKFDISVVDAMEKFVASGEIVAGPGGKLVSSEEAAETLISEIIENFKNLYAGKNLEKH